MNRDDTVSALWTISCLGIFFLQGCGGGNQMPPIAETPQLTSIQIEETVPDVARARITQIVSPVSAGAVGSRMQTIRGTENLLLGLDAGGDIVIAALSSRESTAFDAESTATALVRIAIGPLPSHVSSEIANTLIREAEGYFSLLASIQSTLDSGAAPSADYSVKNSVVTVASQAVGAFPDPVVARIAVAASTISEPKVTLPVPYRLFMGGAASTLYVSESNTSNTISILNCSLINWSGFSTTSDGTRISASQTQPDGSVLIEEAGILAIGACKLGPTSIINGTLVPDNNGQAFSVTVMQDAVSRERNLSSLVADTASMALGFMGAPLTDEGCLASIGELLIDQDTLRGFSTSTSYTPVSDYFNSLAFSPVAISKAVEACGSAAHPPDSLARGLPVWLASTSKFALGLSKFSAAVDAATLATKGNQVFKFWKETAEVGICQNPAAVFGGRSIVNCAENFSFEPAEPHLAAGASVTPTVTALDKNGKKTITPPRLSFVSSKPDSASVDPVTGEVRANAIGDYKITVTDPATGVTADWPGRVLKPFLVAANSKVAVSSLTTVSVVDFLGNPLIVPSGTEYGSSDTAIASIESVSSDRRQVRVRANKVGKVTIAAADPNSTNKLAFATATLDIDGEFAFEVIEANPPLDQRLICKQYSDDNMSFSRCTSHIDARIRCVGFGCGEDRFFVAIKRSNRTQRNFSTDIDCGPETQYNYGIDPSQTMSYKLGPWWYSLPTDSWVKAWPSISEISPLANGNSVFTNYTPRGGCITNYVDLDLIFNVYDSVKGTYTEVPLNIAVP